MGGSQGPSYDTHDKRLAVHVEDHPLEYGDFEGLIPEGNYGAGAVIVWDRGEWVPIEDPIEGLRKGKLLFDLKGYKLRGRWTLKIKKSEKTGCSSRSATPGQSRAGANARGIGALRTHGGEARRGSHSGRADREELDRLKVPARRVDPAKVDSCWPSLATRRSTSPAGSSSPSWTATARWPLTTGARRR